MKVELISAFIDENWTIVAHLGAVVWIFLLLCGGVVAIWLLRERHWLFRWKPTEMEISLGKIGKIKIAPSIEVVRIAHNAWIELATRKAGLEFDEEHDVIVEIYDSWYVLFKELRELSKTVPPKELEDKDAQLLIGTIVKALNDGLRPHLTEWQSKFRRWYLEEAKKDVNATKSPQEIQRGYPEYQKLVSSLKDVNRRMVQFSEELRRLSKRENK